MANVRPADNPFSAGMGEIIEDKQGNLWHKSRLTGRIRPILVGAGSIVRVIGGPGGRVVVPSANTPPGGLSGLDAGDLITNTTAFAGLLSATDINVQLALDTLDDVTHGDIPGLTDDDHTIYLLLLGRSGGQVAYGGTGSGDDLTLESTSNATRGYILIAPNGSYSGFYVAAPAALVEIGAGSTDRGPLRLTSGPLRTITQSGLFEFLTDDLWFGITTPAGVWVSQYPPAQSDTYVKATSAFWAADNSTDPANPLTGVWSDRQWLSTANVNQRFHVDLGSAKTITRIYYENTHNAGSSTDYGAKNFTFWGSNSAADFADLTYGNDGTWTQLTTAASQFDIHVSADTVDPKYIVVTNATAYRYYAVKIADAWGASSNMGVRRIELQSSEDPLVRKNVMLGDGTVLTATRVPFATTNGRLTDDADFTFASNRLTCWHTLPAGTATAGTAPLVFTAGGVVLTTPLSGALEAAGDLLYYTIPTGPTRKTIAFTTDITAVKLDDLATPDDNTDLNASNGAHGLLPKLGGGSVNFLRADGTWNDPLTGLTATKNFTTAEGTHEVVISKGLITSWTITP